MPALFSLVPRSAFLILQEWTGCQLLVEEVLERRVTTEEIAKLECTWHVDGKFVLEEGWYENGQKKYEHPYKDGKEHGICRGWHKNGENEYEWPYNDGKEHGIRLGWYKNGRKNYKHPHKDGKGHGIWRRWSETGQKWCEETWENGIKL